MTGRGKPTGGGKPRKKNDDSTAAPSPTRPEETKEASLPSSQGKTLTIQKQNDVKEIKPTKESPSHNEDKPSSGRPRGKNKKTTEHVTASGKPPGTQPVKQPVKQQASPTSSTEDLGKSTKGKTRCKKAKSLEQPSVEVSKSDKEPQSDTSDHQVKTPKAKKLSTAKAKSADETTVTHVAPTEASPVTNGVRADVEKSLQQAAKAQAKKDEKSQGEEKTNPDKILKKTLSKLTIKRDDRSEASRVVNHIIDRIRGHLKENSQSFKEVDEPLRTGSYYENLKISHPDEFDVMMPIPIERVNIKPFTDDGAFYSVGLKRSLSQLKNFQDGETLSASKMLQEFRDEVKKCIKPFPEWKMTEKKAGCPAVTMTTKLKEAEISLDVVLCLKIKSCWPDFTKEGLKIESWLGSKVRLEYRRKPYYLVPKYEGKGTEVVDDVLTKDVWRISFSNIEKGIMKNHGQNKTCCEKGGDNCCRKECLKLLKHLLSLLKERNPRSFGKFYSYHAKTTLLRACCSRTADSDWKSSDLNDCFQRLLQDFEGHLESGELYNFFIPTQNLLARVTKKDRQSLVQRIREEREQGFPIFQ